MVYSKISTKCTPVLCCSLVFFLALDHHQVLNIVPVCFWSVLVFLSFEMVLLPLLVESLRVAFPWALVISILQTDFLFYLKFHVITGSSSTYFVSVMKALIGLPGHLMTGYWRYDGRTSIGMESCEFDLKDRFIISSSLVLRLLRPTLPNVFTSGHICSE